MCLISAPKNGGAVTTRNFIPHQVHKAIGVFGAVSVATACVVPGSIAEGIAQITDAGRSKRLDVEHPTGFFTVEMEVDVNDGKVNVERSALLRTARKLMSGDAFVSTSIWNPR
jgi:4-oxalomesaconate tautomerase